MASDCGEDGYSQMRDNTSETTGVAELCNFVELISGSKDATEKVVSGLRKNLLEQRASGFDGTNFLSSEDKTTISK